MNYEIWYKANNKEAFTNILVKANNENDALSIFKKQVAFTEGISKKDYFVKK